MDLLRDTITGTLHWLVRINASQRRFTYLATAAVAVTYIVCGQIIGGTIGALLLMFGGLILFLFGMVMMYVGYKLEELRNPPVALDLDNTTPDPSGATSDSWIVPPEAMGTIYVGGDVESFIDSKTAEYKAGRHALATAEQDEIFGFGANYPALAEIHEEVLAQLDQWGHQNHPNGTGGSTARLNRTNAHKAVEAAAAADDGSLTWAMILREEFTEALAETDIDQLNIELTQIAAVCVSWKQYLARIPVED